MSDTALIFSNNITYSSSRPQMFFKIGVRKTLVISQENTFVGVSV